MSRYIDAKKLSESLRAENCDGCKEMWTDYCSTCWCSVAQLLEMIRNAPTVDAVEVVQCRNCKHAEWDAPNESLACYEPHYKLVDDDFFCKYGERKEKTDER